MNGTKAAKEPVDFKKNWRNGHKSFNAAESRALAEMLNAETAAQEHYDAKRDLMIRPRNPLSGDT